MKQSFGGTCGHSFDLMALDSNVVIGLDGSPLPRFTPFSSPRLRGVNLFSHNLRAMSNMSNPYVFPPFGSVGPVLRFLYGFQIPFTVIVPEICPHLFWWTELMARSSSKVCLGTKGSFRVLLAPSKSGYKPAPCPFNLWACKVSF